MGGSSKRRHTSPVWQHFTEAVTGTLAAVCTLCKETVARTASETTSLWEHLQKHHAKEHSQLKGIDPKQRKLTSSSSSSSSSFSASTMMTTAEQQRAHELLSACGVSNAWSFRSMESNAFKRFCSYISRSRYEPPGRKRLTAITSVSYQRMREVLFNEVKSQMVSITTDGAVLTNGHPYVAVTGHYITDNWQLRDVVLSVERADGKHDGEAVRDLLDTVQESWGIQGRTFAAVTDNGANFVRGVRIWEKIEERLRCSVHTLQLALKDAVNPKKSGHLPYWAAAIKKVKALVKTVKMSSHHSQGLQAIQERLLTELPADLSEGLEDNSDEERECEPRSHHIYTLVVDVCTRFNSICLVFQRIVLLRRELTLLCAQNSELTDIALTDDEWTAVQDATLVLQQAKVVCDILEHSSVPTISLHLPLVDTLCALLGGSHPRILDVSRLHHEARALCERISTNINTRTTHLPDFVLASIALDPRMRRSHAVCAELRLLASQALQRVFASQSVQTFLKSAIEVEELAPSSVAAAAPAPMLAPSSLHALLEQRSESESPALPASEVSRFLQDDRSIAYADCPLQWWRANSSAYPVLAQLARAVLCVPATTASSERVFSYGTITLGTRRQHTDSERVGQLIWQQKNMEVFEKLLEQSEGK
jgi:zinc finger BED domain-containing protein 1 (E3 SUMO-protein ligase ZBED1)